MKALKTSTEKNHFIIWMKRIICSIMLVLILFGIAMWIYLSIYYHSNGYQHRAVIRNIDRKEEQSGRTSYSTFIPEGDIKEGVIFYPGGKVEYDAYTPLLSRLARKGILCVLIHMPYNIAFFDANAADGIAESYPQIKDWYIAGHSLGGVVAESYLENNSKNYKGIIYLASYGTKDIHEHDLRVLSIYGDHDQVVDKEKMEEAKKLMPKDYEEHIIEGGNHAYFGNYGFQKGDGKALISPEEQWNITTDIIYNWIKNR